MSSFSWQQIVAERVVIERLGAAGDGVAGGAYVADALPGEVVDIERDGSRGCVVARHGASPERVEPFCPYFGRCGGCVAQHMSPALYGSWKRDKLAGALRGAGLAVAPGDLADGHGAGRRRVVFHAREVDGRMAVGFMAARSHELVPIADCPITVRRLGPAAVDAAAALAAPLRGLRKPLDVAIVATDAGLDVDIRGTGRLDEARRQRLIGLAGELDLARLSIHGEALIERRKPLVVAGRAQIRPPPGGFLQPTEAGEAILAGLVTSACAGARRVADLFAGSGAFSLRLAEFATVHAVEADAPSVAALDAAARAAPGLRAVTTERRDLFRRPLLGPEIARFDAVVLDPPRAGAEAQVRQLASAAIPLVVMVSCDPGTFARDAATLVAGGMALESVVPVDQFKWSAHLEIVGIFRRETAGRRRR